MMRVIAIDTAARNAIRMSRSYGSPDTVYLFPSNAVPSSRSSKKRGSALMTRDGDAPSGKGTIAVRTSLDVPLVAATRVCCSCGNPAHTLNDCPALYFTDTNNDHSCNWADSIVGKAWLANSETMWQERLVLPRYEIRERYHPAVSPPFLMCDNGKKARNNYGGEKENQNQGNQNQGNQNQGYQNQGNGNQNQGNRSQSSGYQGNQNRNQGDGRGYQGKNPRGG